MTGFTVRKPPPAVPQPVAAPLLCGAKEGRNGVYCTRPHGHAGGHRDDPRDIYWPAEEATS